MYCFLALFSLYLAAARAQQVGTSKAEVHPSLTWQKCTTSGGCVTQTNGKVVLDANWRWVHNTSGYTNCYTGQTWDASICPDAVTCAQNCALEGADYSGTYGITTSGNALTLKFVTKSSGTNVGSRVYLVASDDTNYEMFKLKGKEFTFDVDVSKLPCGLNGALYFTEMDADGGKAKYPNNKAGAKYGTGYCDAQCPRDIKFINGEANVVGWTGSTTDPNSGTGNYGTCCSEMDIWEANSIANAYTPHPCQVDGQTRCTGTQCTTSCDQPGCDWNPYRMGDKTLYGPGATVDTSKKITVVTQFITSDGTATGQLTEIRRLYVQNGVVIQNTHSTISGLTQYDSITDDFCAAQKSVFQDTNVYATMGGMSKMAESFDNGHVLVMSVWDDHAAHMLWLDSNYPLDRDASQPGVARGTCSTGSGIPADVEAQYPDASVTYSNIRFGDIGSTYGNVVEVPVPTTSTTAASSTSTGTVAQFGQCGGNGWTGGTACVSPYTCTYVNDWYSQCL
ncbi:1,4-beta-D-glucan cellobiohydrolase [Ceratobasidium theobromae]|uniref:Glucanase n=1 Tax=Ceratobasidium theobromae TaxID=1582974 RepID=A0A5N5QFX9_9AGAM|nr:1,4-beta-D-glucan cellobiohydrolase [Ceratobasidium theobromae]